MKIQQQMSRFLLAALIAIPCISQADTIPLPYVDIQDYAADTDWTLNATNFTIDATAFKIITGGTNIDIFEDFALNTTGTYTFNPGPLVGTGNGIFSGTFTVGGGLLTGTVDLTIDTLYVNSTSMYSGFFNGTLTYTGGSLAGSLPGGLITGEIGRVGTEKYIIAKAGSVVPLPAAVWLFGSGLLGLVAVSRRKPA